MAEKIIVEPLHDSQVIRITLHAPKANVLDGVMMRDIQILVAQLPRTQAKESALIAPTADRFAGPSGC